MTEQQTMFRFPEIVVVDPLAGLPVARCAACGAPMVWVVTEHGRAMPLDPAPVANGNIVVVTRDCQIVARYLGRGDSDVTGPLYQSHFASCPEAGRFRRRRCRDA